MCCVCSFIAKLSNQRCVILSDLMTVLSTVASHSDANRMTSTNLTVCLAPNLLITSTLKAAAAARTLVALMIDNADTLFDTDAARTVLASGKQVRIVYYMFTVHCMSTK